MPAFVCVCVRVCLCKREREGESVHMCALCAALNGNDAAPSQPLPVAKPWALPSWWDCYLLVTSAASLHTAHSAPPCVYRRRANLRTEGGPWHRELCTLWPDTSVRFAHLPFFQAIVYAAAAAYTVGFPRPACFGRCRCISMAWCRWTHCTRQTWLLSLSDREDGGVCIMSVTGFILSLCSVHSQKLRGYFVGNSVFFWYFLFTDVEEKINKKCEEEQNRDLMYFWKILSQLDFHAWRESRPAQCARECQGSRGEQLFWISHCGFGQ